MTFDEGAQLREEAKKYLKSQRDAGIAVACFFGGIVGLWSIYRCCSICVNRYRESRQAQKIEQETQAC